MKGEKKEIVNECPNDMQIQYKKHICVYLFLANFAVRSCSVSVVVAAAAAAALFDAGWKNFVNAGISKLANSMYRWCKSEHIFTAAFTSEGYK